MDKLEQANKLRSLMVGQISHDLRTPLNSMTILLNIAVACCKKASSKEAKILSEQYIQPALINCNLLMSLINDILNFTREDFDQKKSLVMDYEKIEIRSLMKTISIGFSKRAEIRGIDFVYKVDPKIPDHFNTDPRRLTQILNNLIGNSMKFTFEGYIKIELE